MLRSCHKCFSTCKLVDINNTHKNTHFVESALREHSVTLCRGNHCLVAAYAPLNASMTGSALIPGSPVLTADASAMYAMYMCIRVAVGMLPAVVFEGASCHYGSAWVFAGI